MGEPELLQVARLQGRPCRQLLVAAPLLGSCNDFALLEWRSFACLHQSSLPGCTLPKQPGESASCVPFVQFGSGSFVRVGLDRVEHGCVAVSKREDSLAGIGRRDRSVPVVCIDQHAVG